MSFAVRLTTGALDDLERLYRHVAERATTVEELGQADLARTEVMASLRQLERAPFLYRKAADSAFLRELIVPFGAAGYVVLYEIVDDQHVDVLAIRHQLEDDYH